MNDIGFNVSITPADLYRQLAPELRRYLLALLRNNSDVEDALHQTFLKLLDHWESIEVDTAKEWLFTVAYREAITIRRRQTRDVAALAKLWSCPVWMSDNGAERLIRLEEIAIIHQALEELPAKQREVVQRRIHHGETFEKIAKVLGCPLGTTLTRMRLALKKIKQHLEKHRDESA